MQMNGRGPPLRSKHRERCPKCKERVKEFLEKIYGEVKTNYKFDLGTTPEDYRETPYYRRLLEIYRALQNYRGYRKFVKVSTIPRCDFFIPDPGFVVEFDESQHFTIPRKIALEHYPEIELGFDKIKWIMLCEKINARDNNPSYRDEQRAWYDTLRDFLPAIKGLRPTIRLFAGDLVWCRLNPNNPLDLEKFESFFKQCRGGWKIEVREDPKPQLARIIIAGKWDGNVDDAKKLLENVCAKFPKRKKVKIILTCGGFMQFPWPENISPESVRDFKNPSSWVIRTLFDEAERRVRYLLSGGLDEKLKEITDYITLGIDSYKEKNYIGAPHAELVLVIELKSGKYYFAGKSYPTLKQQRCLVRIPDLKSHFVELVGVGRVMVLGCHDLSIFNPRSKNAKGWRKKLNESFKMLARKEKPVCVLHHPHTTVKVRTWLNAWMGLSKELPSVKQYLGAGRYYEENRKPKEYDPLDDVLKHTKLGESIDFIVKIS
jgi:hypothetical protein